MTVVPYNEVFLRNKKAFCGFGSSYSGAAQYSYVALTAVKPILVDDFSVTTGTNPAAATYVGIITGALAGYTDVGAVPNLFSGEADSDAHFWSKTNATNAVLDKTLFCLKFLSATLNRQREIMPARSTPIYIAPGHSLVAILDTVNVAMNFNVAFRELG